MTAQLISNFIRGCKAGVIYAVLLLAYAHVVTKGVTQVHDLDFTWFQDLGPFVIMGVGLGGLLGIADAYLRQRVPAWLLGVAVWAVFVAPSLLLSLVMPARYEVNLWQHLQGLGFALILGLIYEAFRRFERPVSA